MTYPDLFANYDLKGRDWIRRLSPEDLKAFIEIGLKETDYGRKGGEALVAKRGKAYMSEIGRRGAVVTNIKKWFEKAVREEVERELGVTFDY